MTSPGKTSIERVLGLGGAAPARRSRKWWAWGALLPVCLAGLLFWSLSTTTDPMRYRTQPVRRGSLVVTVTATGNLAATNAVEVGSELSGIVRTVEVDFNDRVKVGQPLARLDSTKFEAAVMKSRAALASAEANLQEAKATLKEKEKAYSRQRKTRELTGGRAPSVESLEAAEAEWDRARAGVAVAEAAILEARANLKADETDLAKTVIYSPVDGMVLSRTVEPGQTVAASLQAPVLFTLAEDLTRMELQVDVDEADVGQVREGQAAVFTVDAYPERRFEARITQVRFGSETTDGVVTYKTVLRVFNPDLALRPGMTATADIAVQELENVLLVPNAALRFSPPDPVRAEDGERFIDALIAGPRRRPVRRGPDPDPDGQSQRVWALTPDGPTPVEVVPGPTDGTVTAVTAEGLAPGMELVVEALGARP